MRLVTSQHYIPTKNNFNNTQNKIQSNNLQQTTTYSRQFKKKKANIIYASPGQRRDDGWRNDWRMDQEDNAASHFADRPTRIQKSSRASDDHTHTSMVTTTSYIQTSTTFNRHQSQLPLTFKTFNTFYFRFLRARTCSLHFTLTD